MSIWEALTGGPESEEPKSGETEQSRRPIVHPEEIGRIAAVLDGLTEAHPDESTDTQLQSGAVNIGTVLEEDARPPAPPSPSVTESYLPLSIADVLDGKDYEDRAATDSLGADPAAEGLLTSSEADEGEQLSFLQATAGLRTRITAELRDGTKALEESTLALVTGVSSITILGGSSAAAHEAIARLQAVVMQRDAITGELARDSEDVQERYDEGISMGQDEKRSLGTASSNLERATRLLERTVAVDEATQELTTKLRSAIDEISVIPDPESRGPKLEDIQRLLRELTELIQERQELTRLAVTD